MVAGLILLLPVLAYLVGYVAWGRSLKAPRWDGTTPMTWRQTAHYRAFQMWGPLREWETQRGWDRAVAELSGTWALPDGRGVEIRLGEFSRGWLRSEGFSQADCEGRWMAGVFQENDHTVFWATGLRPPLTVVVLRGDRLTLHWTDKGTGAKFQPLMEDGQVARFQRSWKRN